jgi:hypothetical protein
MIVRFTKIESRCRMWCKRADGSDISWDGVMVGSIPHDLVHWIVEDYFQLKGSFYGHIALGHDPYSVNELANRDSELSQTELLVLCLQGELALLEGIIHAPVETIRGIYGMRYPDYCSKADVAALVERTTLAMARWQGMKNGKTIECQYALRVA